jgi:cysteine desulfurase / selenocysteine lyase
MTAVTERPLIHRTLDTAKIRADFPILDRLIHGHRLVYLDSAATSQKPTAVLEAIADYYATSNANVHRGVYLLAEEATELYEGSRARVAAFVGAGSTEEVIFTRNATEAINLVAYSWGRQNIEAGDAIVISPAEHHSNFVPWQALALERSARLELLDLTPEGMIALDSLDLVLAHGNVKLVAIAGVSNVLGTINPVAEIARRAHAAGSRVLVDAAQLAPHMALDVVELEADFVALTGHKMLAPMGIGVLWAKRELLEAMPPFLYGGEMIRKVTESTTTWNDLPWKFEAGTPNVEGAVGLMAAIDYLDDLGMEAVREHEKALVRYALDRMSAVEGVSVIGPGDAERRGGVIAFTVAGIHPHDLASIVDRHRGVAIRAGHHCAQPLHDRLGLEASARASFYVYNQPADVDMLCEAIEIAERIMAG